MANAATASEPLLNYARVRVYIIATRLALLPAIIIGAVAMTFCIEKHFPWYAFPALAVVAWGVSTALTHLIVSIVFAGLRSETEKNGQNLFILFGLMGALLLNKYLMGFLDMEVSPVYLFDARLLWTMPLLFRFGWVIRSMRTSKKSE